MNLPKAVQRDLERADQLLGVNQPAPAEEPTETEPNAEPTEQASTAPVNEAPAPSEPNQASEPDPGAYSALEQKYRTLQGLHRTQKQRADRLQETVEQLTHKVDELIKAQQTQQTQPEQPKEQADPTLLSRVEDEFGADLVNLIRVVAKDEASRIAANLGARLDEMERTQGATVAGTVEARKSVFFDRLAARVPDWETINVDDDFNDWLDVTDPIYRTTRRDALNAAAAEFDVETVVGVFMAFKAYIGQGDNAPAPSQQAKPADALHKQVVPAKTVAAPTTSEPAKKVWTQHEVHDFYQRVTQGHYRGREAEAEAVEKEINLALSEGRIR